MSYADALAEFVRAMELEGVKPAEPILGRLATGELIRFRCDGDGRGRQNGWAILYLDERPAGAFGNYRLGISRKWRVDRDVSLTAAERQALQREWAEAKQRRIEERLASEREASLDAAEIWASAGAPSPDHGYVARKQLVTAGMRQLGERLIVPMYDGEGEIRNLQRIAPDGTKRFLKGGRTTALFFVFGTFTRRGERVCIGEGISTMSAVHRSTGYPAVAAFSATNLPVVARLWWSQRPDLDFVICGDDDVALKNNVGRAAAEAAANEIGARLAFPLQAAA